MQTYEKVNAAIHVVASFADTKVIPHSFVWGNKRYTVKKVNLVHTQRAGAATLHYFSVSDEANTFKLCFNPLEMKWRLEEFYTE